VIFDCAHRRHQTGIEERAEALPEFFRNFFANAAHFFFERLPPRVASRQILCSSEARLDVIAGTYRTWLLRVRIALPPEFAERLPRRAFHCCQRFGRFASMCAVVSRAMFRDSSTSRTRCRSVVCAAPESNASAAFCCVFSMWEFSNGSNSRTVRSATALLLPDRAARRGMLFHAFPKFLPRACGSRPAPLPTALVRLQFFPQAVRAVRRVSHLAKYSLLSRRFFDLHDASQPRFSRWPSSPGRIAGSSNLSNASRHRRLRGFLHPAPHHATS